MTKILTKSIEFSRNLKVYLIWLHPIFISFLISLISTVSKKFHTMLILYYWLGRLQFECTRFIWIARVLCHINTWHTNTVWTVDEHCYTKQTPNALMCLKPKTILGLGRANSLAIQRLDLGARFKKALPIEVLRLILRNFHRKS